MRKEKMTPYLQGKAIWMIANFVAENKPEESERIFFKYLIKKKCQSINQYQVEVFFWNKEKKKIFSER